MGRKCPRHKYLRNIVLDITPPTSVIAKTSWRPIEAWISEMRRRKVILELKIKRARINNPCYVIFPRDDVFSRKVCTVYTSNTLYELQILFSHLYLYSWRYSMCKAQNVSFIVTLHHLLNETFCHSNLK